MRVDLASVSSPVYLDTNVFIYAVDKRDPRKHTIARDLIGKSIQMGICQYSVQVMAEWRNVMIRKFHEQMSAEYRAEFLKLLSEHHPSPMTGELICRAEAIVNRYSISPFDSTHIQSALDVNCLYFFSEDMQDGLVIDGKLTIINPFADS
ncbi:MAG: PIN domain-containing protein [Verrucomicrobia bacterium]|nr:PIN domain-containing protein [Verrucomicrobiota bacterium]MCH8513512.1 PIN domain-containing protein [Kiritimatiellia bacterium]